MQKPLIVLLLLIAACKTKDHSTPAGKRVAFKTGDLYAFRDSANNYFAGFLFVTEKKDDGIWYGLCLADYYGPEIPAETGGMKFSGGKEFDTNADKMNFAFDVVWFRDTVFLNNRSRVTYIKNLDLLHFKLSVAGEDTAYHYAGIGSAFHRAISETDAAGRQWFPVEDEHP